MNRVHSIGYALDLSIVNNRWRIYLDILFLIGGLTEDELVECIQIYLACWLATYRVGGEDKGGEDKAVALNL